jgi:hypothetical protein
MLDALAVFAVFAVLIFVVLIAIGSRLTTSRGTPRIDNPTVPRVTKRLTSSRARTSANAPSIRISPGRRTPKGSAASKGSSESGRATSAFVVNPKEVSGEIYLDIETQRLSSEVAGGWSNIEGFGLAIAVTWDLENRFRIWTEDKAIDLISELQTFSRIVTYNGDRFDIRVLAAYGRVSELRERSFDVLAQIRNVTGRLVSLDHVARHTLGEKKSADGIAAVRWWREGRVEKVATYCRHDVELLIHLVAFARENGYVVINSRQVRVAWIPLEVTLADQTRGNNAIILETPVEVRSDP